MIDYVDYIFYTSSAELKETIESNYPGIRVELLQPGIFPTDEDGETLVYAIPAANDKPVKVVFLNEGEEL